MGGSETVRKTTRAELVPWDCWFNVPSKGGKGNPLLTFCKLCAPSLRITAEVFLQFLHVVAEILSWLFVLIFSRLFLLLYVSRDNVIGPHYTVW